MVDDVVRSSPHLFLGSRLRRLGERMQADVAQIVEHVGLPIHPSQYSALEALARFGPLSVGELAEATGARQPGVTRTVARLGEMGLIKVCGEGPDRRVRKAMLSDKGVALMEKSHAEVWPKVEGAVRELCDAVAPGFMDALTAIETALDDEPLDRRALRARGLEILRFSDDLAREFHDINAEWIEQMFVLEPTDRESLENPRESIINPGGDILFVRAAGLGVIGACALKKTGEGAFELTKMGVRSSARGRKAGEFLLQGVIARAREMGATKLYLLTNKRCEAAIHLYEKAGFRHDAGIMAEYGERYLRCNVAMRYVEPPLASTFAAA